MGQPMMQQPPQQHVTNTTTTVIVNKVKADNNLQNARTSCLASCNDCNVTTMTAYEENISMT